MIQASRIAHFSGHVFNFQTSEGWYGANGIVASNCRCTVVVAWASRRGELPEESREADDLWRRSGAKFRGKDALRAMERAQRAQREGRDIDEAVFGGPDDDPDLYRRKARGGRRSKPKNPAVPGIVPADDARAVLG